MLRRLHMYLPLQYDSRSTVDSQTQMTIFRHPERQIPLCCDDDPHLHLINLSHRPRGPPTQPTQVLRGAPSSPNEKLDV